MGSPPERGPLRTAQGGRLSTSTTYWVRGLPGGKLQLRREDIVAQVHVLGLLFLLGRLGLDLGAVVLLARLFLGALLGGHAEGEGLVPVGEDDGADLVLEAVLVDDQLEHRAVGGQL